MWGSSFADLAKKAQELQEQASSISSGELFNLDAMQSMAGKPDNKQSTQQSNDPTPSQTNAQPTKSSFPLPTLNESSIPVAAPKPQIPPAQKGKLKMVKKKSPRLGAVKLTTSKVPELSLNEAKPDEPTPNADAKPKLDSSATENQDQQEDPTKEETEAVPEKASEEGKEATIATEPESKPDTSVVNNNDPQSKPDTSVENNNVESPAAPATESQSIPVMNEAKEAPPADNAVHNEAILTPSKGGSDEVQKEVVEEKPATQQPAENCDANDATNGKPAEESTDSEIPVEGQTKQAESEKQEAAPKTNEAGDADDSTDQGKKEPSGDAVDQGSATVQAEPSDMDETKAFPNVEQMQTEATESAPEPPTSEAEPPLAQPSGANSDQVMQQFTAQLQRLEANFEAERKEMQLQHQKSLEQAVAAKQYEMEQVQSKLKEKDLKLRELKRIKEGNELRMDSLKREVQGIKELLKQRDTDMETTKDEGKKEKTQLEQKIRAMELEQGKTKAELKSLKDELENSRGKLGETSDEYTNLKSRVKIVASELKDRRAECRELKSKIEELEDQNGQLQDQISTLDSQLSDRDRSGSEKEEEANSLRAEIEQLQRKVKEGEKNKEAQELAHEKNLASYKKKAQNSLAVANARAAAAIQSKEEAELEARAARSTADTTLERAKIAEANGQRAMAEAKEYYKEMEQAKNKALKELEVSKAELESTQKSFSDLMSKWELLVSEKERLGVDSAKQAREIETERSKATNLQHELAEAQRRVTSLQSDVTALRSQLQKAEATVAADAKKSSNSTANDANPVPPAATATEDSNSKATIMMLQKQLQRANETIEELKGALESAVEMNDKPTEAAAGFVAPKAPETNGGNGMGSPLFYAMEKQAELNTARNEINRLASLYADVQSEKVEAQDALKAAQRELDEETAKLQRYEKLGSVSEGSGAASSGGGRQVNGHQNAGSDSGRTNIEYLKNIMMSYLNAKTLAEKKALVPVIGAVLCLTPDEQAKAIQNIDASGGIEGFGAAFFETLGSKVKG